MKIKLFSNTDWSNIETEVNNFINNNEVDIVSIKHSFSDGRIAIMLVYNNKYISSNNPTYLCNACSNIFEAIKPEYCPHCFTTNIEQMPF